LGGTIIIKKNKRPLVTSLCRSENWF